MKKIVLLTLIFLTVITSSCITKPQEDTKTPEDVIRSLIPSSWEIKTTEKTVPEGWSGNLECTFIELDNPSEKYQHEMGFNYTAWHDFWFCPTSWNGTCTSPACEPDSVVQEYAAGLLCNCKKYGIFYLSLGENSEKYLPDKVKEKLS